MTAPIIEVSGLSKRYRLGEIGVRSLRDEVERFFGRCSSFLVPRSLLTTNQEPRNENNEASFWALRDVSFEVRPGEVLGIIGKNGAGKSTLLKILSRITEPTSGEAILRGRVASLLEVGTGFHPDLSGRDNIYLNGAILGMKHREITARLDEIIAFAGVEAFMDTPVKHYSSGMYVRLAFAVAAHLDPDILVVDEVLAVGDLAFQKRCLGKMQDISRSGRTVLFVTHQLGMVSRLCSRAILLRQGGLAFDGHPQKAIEEYVGEPDAKGAETVLDPAGADPTYGLLLSLRIENSEGRALADIACGQPWRLRIRFRLNRDLPHVILGIGLQTLTEHPLRTSWSEPKSLAAGEYEAVFEERGIVISPGAYRVVVGISDHEKQFHYVENAGMLRLIETDLGMPRYLTAGSILNRMKYSIEPVS